LIDQNSCCWWLIIQMTSFYKKIEFQIKLAVITRIQLIQQNGNKQISPWDVRKVIFSRVEFNSAYGKRGENELSAAICCIQVIKLGRIAVACDVEEH
ncbi:hypothetical protein T4C_386, partial [Trichinella pseudospiralis]